MFWDIDYLFLIEKVVKFKFLFLELVLDGVVLVIGSLWRNDKIVSKKMRKCIGRIKNKMV